MALSGEAARPDGDETPLRWFDERSLMSLIQVKVIENVFTRAQKQEMIERLTDAMVEVQGEGMRPVTLVTIEEVASGAWGVAGNAMTTQDLRALQAEVTV
jgi:4-oxalocrotonate tautomerase